MILSLNLAGNIIGSLQYSFYYLIDYDMYLMPGGRGRYAFEQQGLAVWQKSNTFRLSFGYKLIAGEYPFGAQAHFLPTINIQFGW